MEETKQPIVLNIRLNLDQINVILATLGKLPYESIAPLMNSIQSQAVSQYEQIQQSAAQANGQAMGQEESSSQIIQ